MLSWNLSCHPVSSLSGATETGDGSTLFLKIHTCNSSQFVLQDLAEDGADLCKKAGYVVEGRGDVPCFDGTVPPEEECPSKDGHMDELWLVAVMGVGLVPLFFVAVIGGAALSFKLQAQQLARASKSSKEGSGRSVLGKVPTDAAQLRQRRLEKFACS